MTVAAGAPAKAPLSKVKLIAMGVIGGLVGIYLTPIHPILPALGAVPAIVWGADAIRRVASYGLGTGTPSIGYMSLAIAIVGAIAGLAGVMTLNIPTILGPLFGFVLSMVLGAVVAFLGLKALKMKIPVLLGGTTELAGAAALSVLGFSAAIAGSYNLTLIVKTVVDTGFIALLFIMNTMAIQHPFNACLGPNENQVRTLKLAASTGFLSMTIVGLLAMTTSKTWWIIALIGAIAWFWAIGSFIKASTEEAASVKWTGLWPKEEEV